MPHRPRSGRDGSPEFERYIKPLPLADLNMKFLNNPRLSKNQRQFIVRTYRKAHPDELRRERQKKRFTEKHANISKAEMHRRRRAAEKARRKRP